MKIFINLFERAFKVMKNGIYFIVIALLVAKLFKILSFAKKMACDITMWTQKYGIFVQIRSLQG